MTSTPTLANPAVSRRLSSQDASFLYNESMNGPMHIGSLSIFEGEMAYETVVKQIEGRLHLVPRYRQKLNFVPFNLGHPTWEDDAGFKIETHIKHHKLPPGATLDSATKAAVRLHEPPLDRSRPLWEMHVFTGVPDHTVMLWKIHHCLVDGVSGIELTNVILDFRAAPDPTPVGPAWAASAAPSPGDAIRDALQDAAREQMERAERARSLAANLQEQSQRSALLGATTTSLGQFMTQPVVATPWSAGLVTQRRSLAWARFPFGEVREIRGALGGTVNDVVLTILSEAAGRYLKEKGIAVDGRVMRLGCPVSVRREDQGGALGNRVSMMFPTLPAQPMDAAARLTAVSVETGRIKGAREPQGLEILTEMGDSVPPSVVAASSQFTMGAMDLAAAWGANAPVAPTGFMSPQGYGINFVATNVPASQVPQYLAGHQMLDMVGLMPLGGTLGYGVAIGSYNQSLYIAMMAEPRLMPDVDHMRDLAEEVFGELRDAATTRAAAAS
ncbi:MAG: wax ester/triacylglycerol synthase family O-acyltransferase [Tepidiformaceae bacterium]